MDKAMRSHETGECVLSTPERKNDFFPPMWVPGIMLAAMPALSFALQFWFSSQDNTLPLLFSHYTVSYVDWLFVPFNFFVVYAVNWRRGGLLFLAMVFSVVFNVIAHAYWQHTLIENTGHMFGREHLVLRSGWVHVAYATIQMTLLMAFLLVRQPSPRYGALLTYLCVVYFVSAGISGYIMNDSFMVTDVIMVSLGLVLTLVYPRFAYGAVSAGAR
jgi:hypothetical protein